MDNNKLHEVREEMGKAFPKIDTTIFDVYKDTIQSAENAEGVAKLLDEYLDGVKRAFVFKTIQDLAANKMIEIIYAMPNFAEICKHTNNLTETWAKVKEPTSYALKKDNKPITIEPLDGYLFERRKVDVNSASSLFAMLNGTQDFISALNGTIARKVATSKITKKAIVSYFAWLLANIGDDTEKVFALLKQQKAVLDGTDHSLDDDITEWYKSHK